MRFAKSTQKDDRQSVREEREFETVRVRHGRRVELEDEHVQNETSRVQISEETGRRKIWKPRKI